MDEFEIWRMANAIIGETFVLAELEAAWRAAQQAQRERVTASIESLKMKQPDKYDDYSDYIEGYNMACNTIQRILEQGGA